MAAFQSQDSLTLAPQSQDLRCQPLSHKVFQQQPRNYMIFRCRPPCFQVPLTPAPQVPQTLPSSSPGSLSSASSTQVPLSPWAGIGGPQRHLYPPWKAVKAKRHGLLFNVLTVLHTLYQLVVVVYQFDASRPFIDTNNWNKKKRYVANLYASSDES